MPSEDDEPPRPLGFEEAPAVFRGPTQIARIQTELWASRWLFCPNCGAHRLAQFTANSPVADLHCEQCREEFELKSTKRRFGRKVVDGAYATMTRRIQAQNNPNLILLTYDPESRSAIDVVVIPKQFFVPDIIEPRRPLAATARRAGWIGCNILLDRIPDLGRIPMLREREPAPRAVVLEQWRRTTFLRGGTLDARGWLLEVLKIVEGLRRSEFTLADIYAREERLQAVYPGNRNVRSKIRQQLQVLRDHGLLEFLGNGSYRLR